MFNENMNQTHCVVFCFVFLLCALQVFGSERAAVCQRFSPCWRRWFLSSQKRRQNFSGPWSISWGTWEASRFVMLQCVDSVASSRIFISLHSLLLVQKTQFWKFIFFIISLLEATSWAHTQTQTWTLCWLPGTAKWASFQAVRFHCAPSGANSCSTSHRHLCFFALTDLIEVQFCLKPPGGRQEVPLNQDFFVSFGKTILKLEEIAVSVFIPFSRKVEMFSMSIANTCLTGVIDRLERFSCDVQ